MTETANLEMGAAQYVFVNFVAMERFRQCEERSVMMAMSLEMMAVAVFARLSIVGIL
jgi:hypothetical protein